MGALDRSRLLDLVDRRGTSPLSFLIRYDAPWQAHWAGDGAVAYLEGRRAAVAWSDPLCEPEALADVLRSFDEEMRRQRRGVCLIAVGEDTARAALELGFSVLKVGEEPWFDLTAWQAPVRGDPGKKLRWLLNHARAADVAVFHYGPGLRPPGLEADVEAVLERWRRRSRPAGDELVHAHGAAGAAGPEAAVRRPAERRRRGGARRAAVSRRAKRGTSRISSGRPVP